MATTTFNTRISLKYDTYANWVDKDPQLLVGEVAVVVVPADTGAVAKEPAVLFKVGDGAHKFSELQFTAGLAADVYDWAKAANKPTYSASEITGLSDYISGEIQDTDTQYKLEVDADNDRKFHLYSQAKGTSTWNLVSTITIPDETVYTLAEGTANGTVKFNGKDVKVHGLGTAAYKDEGAFDAAGAADTALEEAKTYANGKDAAIAAAKKAGDDAQAAVDALEELVGTLPDGATATTVVGYVDEKVGAIPAQTDYTVTVTPSTPDGVAKRYNIKQTATNLDVNIDIPKDMVVESGSVETKDAAGAWGEAGTYLHLVLANATEDDIYINVGTDWYFEPKVVDNLVWLTKKLMAQYNIPADHVIRHYDVTGKLCPRPWCCADMNVYYKTSGDAQWEEFKKRISDGKEEDEDMTLDTFKELMKEYRAELQDNDCGTWSKEAREWAISNGLINGTGTEVNGEPNYAWADQLTREQAAALFYRFAKLMGKA